MSNHIHLLLREGRETLAQIMKRIGTSYVYWYNMKYERCGHLFQDRFRSEIIEDDRHLLAVLRYIHQNPQKAGMVAALAAYIWSSYHEYIKQEGMVIDPKFVLNYFHSEPNKALESFKRFMEQENRESFLDAEVSKKKIITDEQAKTIIFEMAGLDNPQVLQMMSKKERDAVIKKLREEHISIRQLARLTGIGRRIIEKAAFYSHCDRGTVPLSPPRKKEESG